jgi:NADH-quinone oxidoreductase subunit G
MELVTITIDGTQYQAPKGKLLLEFCLENKIDIPNFCYYPDLTSQAACRMCLVRIEKIPKLATACTVTITDGMVVAASSEEVVEARKGMLDFILGNHPLDCPVCDKGGQCELQDMAFEHGALYADYDVKKNHKEERRLSPFIAYDEQRCVKCYRCVRVCEDWMDVHALTKIFRGTKEVIGFYGNDLSCEQCGNCVEVCPVGALLSVDSRFKSRPWDMKEQQTTCTFCADGCQLDLGVRGEEYVRAASKDLKGINGEFLCVKGRYGSGFISSPERLKSPLIKKNGQLVAATWDEAFKFAAERMKAVTAAHGGASVAVVGSPRITNEANFALARLGHALGTPHLAHFRNQELGDFHAHLSAPIATHEDIRQATTLLLLGGDPTENSPLAGFAIRAAKRKHDAKMLVVNRRPTKIARRQADTFLHVRPEGENAVVRALLDETSIAEMAKVAGVAETDLRAVRDAVFAADNLVIVIGPEIEGAALKAVARLAEVVSSQQSAVSEKTEGEEPKPAKKISYLALAQYNNSVGAFDMGLAVNAGHLRGHFGHAVKAAWFVGADPVSNDGEDWKSAIRALDFVVVNELFLTETAKLADVVFPVTSYAEQDGTFTNHAGQVQRVARVLEGKGQLRPDWLVIQALAREMKLDVKSKGSAGAILKDIAEVHPAYAGVSLAAIKLAGGAFRVNRKLADAIALAPLLTALREQVASIDATAKHDDRIVEMGEGLFRRGTLLDQVPVFEDAQPFWEAHRGEWEGMNLEDDFHAAAASAD